MAKTVVKGRGLPGKETENYTLYDDGTILLRGVRGSYVHVGRPFKSNDPKDKDKAPKYSMVLLLDKTTHDKAKRLVDGEIDKMLKDRNRGNQIDDNARFLRDGDQKRSKPEYAGQWTINVSQTADRPPVLRGMQNERIDRDMVGEAKIAGMFPSGFYYDVLISPWWQDNAIGGKKVNANVLAVKVAAKGELFATGGITDDDVDDVFGVSGDTGGFGDDEGDL
jgi:hypothetical protein